jgi:hypothetical protein
MERAKPDAMWYLARFPQPDIRRRMANTGRKAGGSKRSKTAKHAGKAATTDARKTRSGGAGTTAKSAARVKGAKQATKRATRPFEARRSSIQGRGVFATRAIKEGTRLLEYKGEIISEDEADIRYPFDEEERHHTFLFRIDSGEVIDAGPRGSIAKYINHSCDPNCEAVEEDNRIFIDAIRDIRRGEELVYDYNFILDEPHNAANKKLYPCNCGSRSCRGTILAKKR